MWPDTSCPFRILVDSYLGNIRHNYYSFMSRSTCIPLYPAIDGRQTGDNFVADADTRYMSTATMNKWIQVVSGNMYPGVNAAFNYNSVK